MDDNFANAFEMPGVESKKQQKPTPNGFAGRRPEPGQQAQTIKRPPIQSSQPPRGSQQASSTGPGSGWQSSGACFGRPTQTVDQATAQPAPSQPNTHPRPPYTPQQPPAGLAPSQFNTHLRPPHPSQQPSGRAPAIGQRQDQPIGAPIHTLINLNFVPLAERDRRRQEAERANAQAVAAEQRKQATEANARKLAAKKQREQDAINARHRQREQEEAQAVEVMRKRAAAAAEAKNQKEQRAYVRKQAARRGAEQQQACRDEQAARSEAEQRPLNQSAHSRANSGLALPPNRNNPGLALPPERPAAQSQPPRPPNRNNIGLALPPGRPVAQPQPPQPGPTPKLPSAATGKDKSAKTDGGGEGIMASLAKQTKLATAKRGGDSKFAFQQQDPSDEQAATIQAELLKRDSDQHSGLFVSDSGSAGSNGANDRDAHQAQVGFSDSLPMHINGQEASLSAAPLVKQAPKEITEDEKQLLARGIKKTPEPPMHSQFAGTFSGDTRRQRTKAHQPPRPQGLDQSQTSIQQPTGGSSSGSRSLHNAAANGMFRQTRPDPPPAPDPHRKWALSTEDRPRAAGDAAFRRNNDSPAKASPIKGPGGRLLLGQLTLRDIKLVKWRDEGAQWGEVLAWQAEEHGVTLSEEPTRRRYRQVLWHMNKAGIPTELCQAAVDGNQEALAEINDTLRAQGLDQSSKTLIGTECNELRFFPKTPKAPKADEVEASDIQMYLWKTQEKPRMWAEIIQYREDHQLQARSETWLHNRQACIAKALEAYALDLRRDLLSKATRNTPEGEAALVEVNNLISQNGGSVSGSSAPRVKAASRTGNGTSSSSNQKQAVPRDVKPFVPGLSGPQVVQPQPRLSHGFKRPPQGYSEDSSRSSQIPVQMQPEHPHFGGKTMNDATYQALIGQIHESYEPEPASDEEDEPSPITDADYCHFAYQVERRECTQERAEEEDIHIDQLPWFACNDPFDSIKKANKAANRDLMLMRPGGESMVTSKSTVETSTAYDEHGLIQLELRSELGRVEMRVTRHLRTFRDRIAPTNKEGWAPKCVYFVKIKKMLKSRSRGDDLFGENQEKPEPEPRTVPSVYCSLRLANFRAIDEFVSETLVHRTANLDQRAIDWQQAVEGWRDAIEGEGEDVGFRQDAEDDRKVVEVWVEQGELVGPRNVF